MNKKINSYIYLRLIKNLKKKERIYYIDTFASQPNFCLFKN